MPTAGSDGRALTARDAAANAVRVGEPGYVEGRLHWVASARDGSGRSVLCAGAPGSPAVEVSPDDVSVRSRLFGYGAGSWCATPLGMVVVDAPSQSLVLLTGDGPAPRSPALDPGSSIGDPEPVAGTPFVMAAVELRTERGWCHGLQAIDVEAGGVTTVLARHGRCAEPRVSRDGTRVAWLEWPLRTLPWQAAELFVATLERTGGTLRCGAPRRVDGGVSASVGQPTWLAGGGLAYVSEAAGWWQPWVCDDGGVVRRLHGAHAEFQRPRWATCRWLAAHGDALACAFADRDGEHVGVLGLDGTLETLDQPCVRVDGVAADPAAMAWVGATPSAQGVVLTAGARASMGDDGATPPRSHERQWVAVGAAVAPPTSVLEPTGFEFTHDDVVLDGVLWHPGGVGPWPLVLLVHPGPTGAADRSYSPTVHLLVAHGIAAAAVDYSGSTAHGRTHRTRLDGRFGILDVAECVAAAAHLVAAGVARRDAVFMRGTSAGGTTALLSLASGTVRGAVAWYPASSFEDADDDGVEAGYLETLTGGVPPAARSPLGRAHELRGRALVVQGALDDVVPLAETERLCDALWGSLREVTLVVVEGEGHGFRTVEGRARALDAELAFYERLASVAGGARDAGYDATAAPPRTPAAGEP